MCIFSGKVEEVTNTNIFVTDLGIGIHGLVYEMKVDVEKPVAMILPVPVMPDSGENALSFIDLSDYPKFFKDMKKLYPEPVSRGMSKSLGGPMSFGLKVHDVGSFVASFVPSVKDLVRLDPQFRLNYNVIAKLPDYSKFGFAVFQLKPNQGLSDVHPMAYRYTAAKDDELFIPTTHVHDGETVHDKENFDHSLYYQHSESFGRVGWEQNKEVRPVDVIEIGKTFGLVHPLNTIERFKVKGEHKNQDYILKRKDGFVELTHNSIREAS